METWDIPALQWKYGKVPFRSSLSWKTDGSPQRDAKKLPGNSWLLIWCPLNYHSCFSAEPLGPLWVHLPIRAGTPVVTFTQLNFPNLGH